VSDSARREWPAGLNGVLGALLGLLLSTIGTFLILIEEGGINVGGNKVDADVLGIPVLAVGVLTIAVSLLSLHRQRRM
jgi:hypothetical protein